MLFLAIDVGAVSVGGHCRCWCSERLLSWSGRCCLLFVAACVLLLMMLLLLLVVVVMVLVFLVVLFLLLDVVVGGGGGGGGGDCSVGVVVVDVILLGRTCRAVCRVDIPMLFASLFNISCSVINHG